MDLSGFTDAITGSVTDAFDTYINRAAGNVPGTPPQPVPSSGNLQVTDPVAGMHSGIPGGDLYHLQSQTITGGTAGSTTTLLLIAIALVAFLIYKH